MAALAALASIGQAGLTLGGGLAGAAGSRIGGSLEKTRKMMEAMEMRRKAIDVEAATDRRIGMIDDDATRVMSNQRAALAAQGVDTADTGAVDLQSNIAARAAKEKTYERQQGIKQAADLILGAGLTDAAGSAAKRAASMQSVGTIIGSVGTAIGQAARGASGFRQWLQSKEGGSSGGWRGAEPNDNRYGYG